MKVKYISPKKIEIDDKSYEESVVVSSKGVVFSWKEQEVLKKKEMEDFIKKDPEVIVIALNGKLKKVPFKTRSLLQKEGITLIVDEIHEAINAFNKAIVKRKSVLGAFPLDG